jgi:hypothetical protein
VTWTIVDIPFHNRDERLGPAEVYENCRERIQDPERRQVTRQLLDHLWFDHGARTFGDAIDALEAAGPAGRRELLNRARTGVGLPTVEDERAHAAGVAANRALIGRGVNPEASPAWARPRFGPGGAIEFGDAVERERARGERDDERRAEQFRQRRAGREHEAAERRAAQEAQAERWRIGGPGWEPAP